MKALKILNAEWPRFSEFRQLMLSIGVVGFLNTPIEIRPRLHSNLYINWTIAASDAYLLDRLTDLILDLIKFSKLNPKCIYGVPESATKLGVVTQLKWAKEQEDFKTGMYAVPMGRGKIKEHGMPDDKFFLGEPKGSTVVVEDVVMEGEALLNTIDRLQSMNVHVIAAIVLTDRNEKTPDGQSVKSAVESRGVKYFAMSNALEFLPEVYESKSPGEAIGRAIEEEYRKRGVEPIKLTKGGLPFFARK